MTPNNKMTIDSAARELLLHPATVRRYIREGCPHLIEDGRLLLVPCDVERWMILRGRYGMPGRPRDKRAAERRAALRAFQSLVDEIRPNPATIL